MTWFSSQVGARFDFLLAELEEPLPLDNVKIAAAQLETRERLPKGEAVGYGGFGAERHGVRIHFCFLFCISFIIFKYMLFN